MQHCVTLLNFEELGPTKLNLLKIIDLMGGSVRILNLVNDKNVNMDHLRNLVSAGGCVIVNARTLSPRLRIILLELKSKVLIYGFNSTQQAKELLKFLTNGTVADIETHNTEPIRVADCREVCGQMAGLIFNAKGAHIRSVFNSGNFTPLLSIGKSPFFVSTNQEGCLWMLLAGDDIADLDEVVPKEASILKFFPGIAPLMMFLRTALPDRFWHNTAPTACFILDDPPLKERYGFLDYKKLMELQDLVKFSFSIAFIPWNYRRSQNRVVEMFLTRGDTCTLSVHGCDHTRGEFGSPDVQLMRRAAQRALNRMIQHRESTGLGFDAVMVFPQGIFSTAATKALKSCDYLAAVNTTPYPIDAKEDLLLRDHLGLAVTRFSNFPIFTRRYPNRLAELAFDLFLGKPALVVEHHRYFRDAGKALTETVAKMNRLDDRLQWTNLGICCSQANLQKTEMNGDICVQFVTDRFVLENKTGQDHFYILKHRSTPEVGMNSFFLNDRHQEFESEADGINIRIKLRAKETAHIRIEREQPTPVSELKKTDFIHQARVLFRRHLCEFRDNYVETIRRQ